MFQAMYLYRVARYLYLKKIPLLPKILFRLNFLIYNCSIPYQASIGKGTTCGHSGIGVVINRKCIIGENVDIGTNVTIGSKTKHGPVPIIGNRVYISTGAKLLGEIKIGSNVIIGANAVVINDIPDNSVVVGIPAKIIKTLSDNEVNRYFNNKDSNSNV